MCSRAHWSASHLTFQKRAKPSKLSLLPIELLLNARNVDRRSFCGCLPDARGA